MQTFLPEYSYFETANVLDYRRLGKQRVETKQILMTLLGESKGWRNHPAVKMWAGHEQDLARYGAIICTNWRERGYRDSLLPYFEEKIKVLPKSKRPDWITEELVLSHRSNLIRKFPEHYQKFWPTVPNDLPYIWPSNL
jgi:hypothetical protein